MKISYEEFSDRARKFRALAESAGIEKTRARLLAEQLAARPLNRAQAARLLAQAWFRARNQPEAYKQRLREIILAYTRRHHDDRSRS
jgi:hypothetical protein